MSLASSVVTYTSVYIDSEPGRVFWGADEELSDGGSLRVIVYGYNGLPMLPVAPPSPDYIHDPIYPEYIPLKDEHILLAKEKPLPPIVSPTTKSPGFVAESNPEEYEDDETKDGDDGDDDHGDSSRDNTDNEDEDEEDRDEEEEHLASADSAIVIPTDEHVAPPKGIEPIIPPPSTNTATTEARITIRL
nr:hypothetical protein [Tanacetum cinerariifolium]